MKKVILGIGLIAILSIFTVFTIMVNSNAPLQEVSTQVSNVQEGLNYEAVACSKIIRKDGTVEEGECLHNVFTDAGKEAFQAIVETGATYGNFTIMGLCNQTAGCSAAAGDTTIDNEFISCGLEMVGGSTGDLGTGNVSIWNTWTATCDGLETNMTGLANQTVAGYTLLSVIWITEADLETDDQLFVNVTAQWS